MKLSPLAPAQFPLLPEIKGVTFATAEAGVRYKGRTDVMLALLDEGSAVAGVFTRSSTRSACVRDCETKLAAPLSAGRAAILVNSGNSNAFTGKIGETAVAAICEAVSAACNIAPERVFTSSTGVIGEPLPYERITAALSDLAANQSASGMEPAARAIMTTDTFPKGATASVNINGKRVQIAGFAKGSGMIAPDMATMLGYVFTDASISQPALQSLLRNVTNRTFNCITVDGDTSTSDTVLLAATGASGVGVEGNTDFAEAVEDVMRDLAQQIVRDGEGASKFVTVNVTGAASEEDASKVAHAIANSPLVKTAIAGEDPNWGRVVMAVGKSGAQADRDRLSISFGDILVAENGWVSPGYSEEDGAAYMKNAELEIHVDLGLGAAKSTVWTCDLTHTYIDINADYRS